MMNIAPTQLSAKTFLESIKYIPTKIWSEKGLIQNPDTFEKIQELQNLPISERRNFITEFCKMTGFPNLKKIREKIDEEIVKVINNLCKFRDTNPLFAGYSANCSVAREKALPGSDCDGLFVLTDKPQYQGMNRAELGFAMNQRLIDSTGMHFPEVFSLDEIMPAIQKVETIYYLNQLWRNVESYIRNLFDDGMSFVKAGQFNIDLAKFTENNYEKDMICHACLFVENLRAGKVLINNIDEKTLSFIKDSILYRFSNITRPEGLAGKLKPKLINREKLCEDFLQMDENEKFQVCKNILEASLGAETNENGCFESFDMGDIIELYKKISSWMD